MKRISSISLQFVFPLCQHQLKSWKNTVKMRKQLCRIFFAIISPFCQSFLQQTVTSFIFRDRRESALVCSHSVLLKKTPLFIQFILDKWFHFPEEFWYMLNRFFGEGAKPESLVWVCTKHSLALPRDRRVATKDWCFGSFQSYAWWQRLIQQKRIDLVSSKIPKLPVMLA